MEKFKEWFKKNYTNRGNLEPSDNLCEVIDEYLKEAVNAKLDEALADIEEVKEPGNKHFNAGIEISKTMIQCIKID